MFTHIKTLKYSDIKVFRPFAITHTKFSSGAFFKYISEEKLTQNKEDLPKLRRNPVFIRPWLNMKESPNKPNKPDFFLKKWLIEPLI